MLVFDSFLTKCLCVYRGKFTLALAVSPDGILLASGAIDGIIAVFEVQVSHLHSIYIQKEVGISRYVGSIIRSVQTDHRFKNSFTVCSTGEIMFSTSIFV